MNWQPFMNSVYSRGNQINIALITILQLLFTNQVKCWFLIRGENLSWQSREPTNSTRILHQVRKSNPGHIGGRQALSPLGQHCYLLSWMSIVHRNLRYLGNTEMWSYHPWTVSIFKELYAILVFAQKIILYVINNKLWTLIQQLYLICDEVH